MLKLLQCCIGLEVGSIVITSILRKLYEICIFIVNLIRCKILIHQQIVLDEDPQTSQVKHN